MFEYEINTYKRSICIFKKLSEGCHSNLKYIFVFIVVSFLSWWVLSSVHNLIKCLVDCTSLHALVSKLAEAILKSKRGQEKAECQFENKKQGLVAHRPTIIIYSTLIVSIILSLSNNFMIFLTTWCISIQHVALARFNHVV